jgi:subtilisin family serine protease
MGGKNMSIDPETLQLKILEPPQTKMAPTAEAQDRGGGADAKPTGLQYDPRLLEEKRRADTDQPASPRITGENEHGQRVVDVIAKLSEEDDKPEGLHIVRHIGNIRNRIVTGTAVAKEIEDIRPKVESIKAARETKLDLFHSIPATQCDPEPLERGAPGFPGLDGSGVLIGIVDVGCDFRHRNFRHPTGATRIRYLWDQSVDSAPPLKDYGYGREFTADDINQALSAGDDAAYQKLGDPPYVPAAGAHGTHVMDVAAGNGREPARFGGKDGPVPAQPSHPGVAPNAQIVFVHLKTFEGGELGNSRNLLEAVDYIFQKADELQMPAVVNVSLSTSGGPHDGKTLVEQGFAALVTEKAGRAIVTSAGNTYQKQDHLSFTVTPGNDRTIHWRTDPRHTDPETTKNEMEIWYSGKRELAVTLYSPSGKNLGSVPLGATADLWDGKQRVGRISHRYHDPNNDDNQIDIRLPHVDDAWEIKLAAQPLPAATEDPTKKKDKERSESEEEAPGIEIHAWIEQDDHGLSQFEGKTDPFYTLSAISCSKATLTVGAFDTADNACLARPFEATSAGPTRLVPLAQKKQPTRRDKPDLSAPGVRIVAARAQGGVTVLSGTSTAAAHVTGLVALVFQLALRSGKGPLPYSTIRDILTGGADALVADPFHPNLQLQLGAGRINGTECMKEVLKLASVSEADQQARPGLAASLPKTKYAVVSANDLLHELIVKLARKECFELKVGNNGVPTDAVLKDLVNKLKDENDYNLNVTPPD